MEFEALDIRLNELYPIVDKFVILESKYTHSGKEKPFYLTENLGKYLKFIDKIHIIQNFDNKSKWDSVLRNNKQRDRATEFLKELDLLPSDLLILGDVDEIPRAATIETLVKRQDVNVTLLMDLYIRKINLHFGQWNHCRVLNYKFFKSIQECYRDIFLRESLPQRRFKYLPIIRMNRHFAVNFFDRNFFLILTERQKNIKIDTVQNGGWHFTQLYDIERIKEKIDAMSHRELAPETLDTNTLTSSIYLTYGLGNPGTIKVLDNSYPKYVLNNQNIFQDFILNQNNVI